jgi:hypothetical protein
LQCTKRTKASFAAQLSPKTSTLTQTEVLLGNLVLTGACATVAAWTATHLVRE